MDKMNDDYKKKMIDMYINFNKYCVEKKYGNIDFLNGLLGSIIQLYQEQKNGNERNHFKHHVYTFFTKNFEIIDQDIPSKNE